MVVKPNTYSAGPLDHGIDRVAQYCLGESLLLLKLTGNLLPLLGANGEIFESFCSRYLLQY